MAVEGLAKVFWEVLTVARAKPLARSEGNFAAHTRCCLPEKVTVMKHVALILTSISFTLISHPVNDDALLKQGPDLGYLRWANWRGGHFLAWSLGPISWLGPIL